jgi:hypothetical protein
LMRLQRETWGNVAPSLNASPAKKRAGVKAGVQEVEKGEVVVYWMRMEDMRGTFLFSFSSSDGLGSRC